MRLSLRTRAFWLLVCLPSLSGCLSEVLIDNYDNHGYAGSASDGMVLPPAAGGSTGYGSVTWAGTSSGGSTNSAFITYSMSEAPLVHGYQQVLWQQVIPGHGYLPLLTNTPSDTVLFIAPPSGVEGFVLAEFSADGDSILREQVFATEPPPSALAVDDAGAVFLAGPLTRDVSFGGPSIAAVEHGYYLVKLSANGDYEFGFGVATTTDAEVAALAPDAAGNLYVGVNGTDTFGAATTHVIAYDSQWHERYRVIPSVDGDGRLETMSLSPKGELLLGGSFTGTMTLGDTVLSTLQSDNTNGHAGWAARFKTASGTATYAARTNMDKANLVSGYLQDEAGNYRQSSYYQPKDMADSLGAPLLRGLDSAMLSSWQAPLGTSGTLDRLLLGANGASYVAGRMWPLGATSQAQENRLYVAEVDDAGSVRSYFYCANVDSLGNTGLISTPWLTVTANQVIWLSYFEEADAEPSAVVLSRLIPLR